MRRTRCIIFTLIITCFHVHASAEPVFLPKADASNLPNVPDFWSTERLQTFCGDMAHQSRLRPPNDLSEEQHVALTNVDVLCNPLPSLRLRNDLYSQSSFIRSNALQVWSENMNKRKLNGKAFLPFVQEWFVDNYDSEWTKAPREFPGVTTSAYQIVTNALIRADALGPLLASPKVSQKEKAALKRQREVTLGQIREWLSPAGVRSE